MTRTARAQGRAAGRRIRHFYVTKFRIPPPKTAGVVVAKAKSTVVNAFLAIR